MNAQNHLHRKIERSEGGMRVRDVMDRSSESLSAHITLSEAAADMRKLNMPSHLSLTPEDSRAS